MRKFAIVVNIGGKYDIVENTFERNGEWIVQKMLFDTKAQADEAFNKMDCEGFEVVELFIEVRK